MAILDQLKRKYHAWRYQRSISQRDFASKTVAEIFTETFEHRYWKSKESVSGIGSEMGQTATIRAALPHFLKTHGIRSLLDLPCGDFNWMQSVQLEGIDYIGADIVPALVEKNRTQFGNAHRRFLQVDLLSDPLPAADCIMVRDCLVHLSFAHIGQAMANMQRSSIRYLLTTSFTAFEKNEDIQTGYWRPLNLERAPFNFPSPTAVLVEDCTEAKGAYADKSLCLWDLKAFER